MRDELLQKHGALESAPPNPGAGAGTTPSPLAALSDEYMSIDALQKDLGHMCV
jgi:hypothetical protein